MRTRRGPDGVVEVIRVGRLRRGTVALGTALVGLPLGLVLLLELIAVLPVIVLLVPPALMGALGFGMWRLRRRWGRRPSRRAGRVILLRRAG